MVYGFSIVARGRSKKPLDFCYNNYQPNRNNTPLTLLRARGFFIFLNSGYSQSIHRSDCQTDESFCPNEKVGGPKLQNALGFNEVAVMIVGALSLFF